ncbi:dihydrofolate reductase family protein [Micromonospora kangleipakensis]|uniref:dihydrofolate reductase family protein n=1 Tax=Micromonospora kangleipakensis TaxID=1077942 RepID=UPI001F5ED684|nr:dihydrofolate reductase family protein [Micromonospora kangleipakensis]
MAEAVAALRAEPGTLLINGSAELLNHLTAHRLVDEYRIMVYPVVIGAGRRLWADGTTADLKLTRSHITTSGVAVLTYVPA